MQPMEFGMLMPKGGMNMLIGTIWTVFALLIFLAVNGLLLYLVYLLIRALRKYLKSSAVRAEKSAVKQSLGETLKEHRVRCRMTQEFVAERIGVSRQAVSKWENGTSDPSTSNLFALAKLYGVGVEELLRDVEAR